MAKKVLTIGGATQDIYIRYANAETMRLQTAKGTQSYLLLQEGAKIEVQDVLYSSGGGAVNTAISFNRMDFDTSTFIKIGDDAAGQFVLNQLKKEGVSIKHLDCTKGGQTGISFIIPSLERDRVIMAMRGINTQMSLKEVPFDQIDKSDLLYITSLSGDSSQLLLPIVQHAHKHNVPIATNPGGSQLVAGAPILRESLKYVDVLIMNSAEAKMFMLSLAQAKTLEANTKKAKGKAAHPEFIEGSKRRLKTSNPLPSLLSDSINVEDLWFQLDHFFQAVLRLGPKVVVVTNGAEGVYAATQDTIYFHPSANVKVINTVGAGDAFGSAFVGCYFMNSAHPEPGRRVEQAIRYGIANATSVISHMDTKEGLLSLKEMEQRAKKFNANLLQKLPL